MESSLQKNSEWKDKGGTVKPVILENRLLPVMNRTPDNAISQKPLFDGKYGITFGQYFGTPIKSTYKS